ncbi:MAG: glycosyltransferase family 39 protein [Desulfobacterales bacterium]
MFEKISKLSESKNGLIYIICVSLVLKSIILMSFSVVNRDGLLYIAAAQKFAEGYFSEGISIYPMPFYSLLITVVHFLIPDWVTAGRIISVAFVVIALVPLYFMTSELFNRKSAFWACLAFAIAPVPNGWADSVIRDPGFICCMAWAVFFALRAVQSKRIIFFAAAALFSWFSMLFRLEGIVFILFFPLYLVALCLGRDNDKVHLLKGVSLWILFPLLFTAFFVLVLGSDGIVSLNRSGDIISQAQEFLNLRFLDNYYVLSEQLVNLEKLSPYPGGMQNFAETARHYIPIIYLFGLLETLIVVMFPLFVVPLFFSFRDIMQKNRIFVLSIFFAFIFMTYYFLINKDFIQKRFLSMPALLLYPWIGAGMQSFFEYLSRRFSKRVRAAVLVLFFIMPVYQCFKQEWKEDMSLMAAAKWIEKEANPGKLKIITTDTRFFYYADREFCVTDDSSFGKDGDLFYRVSENDNLTDIEQIAIQHKIDIMAFRIPAQNIPPQFKYFKKIKEYKGRKNISYIYSSPEALAALVNR